MSMIQTTLEFSEKKYIVNGKWANPYLRGIMAELNLELSRISNIPFNSIQNIASETAINQFQDSTIIVERLFKLALHMSKMDDENRLRLECQLDNIFTFHGINL